MEIIRVLKLNKAVKPYTRTKRGKLEHVRGHERTGLSRVSSAGSFQTGDEVVIWRGENQGKKGVIARTDGFHATVKHDDGTFTEEVAHHRLIKKSLEDGMKKSVMVVSLDEYLNKAVVEPYTRTKKGKMERVGSYLRAGEKKGVEIKGEKEGVVSFKKEGKPDEKTEYAKLKEFGHLLNEEGKARLAELEKKHGEKKIDFDTTIGGVKNLTDAAKVAKDIREAKLGDEEANKYFDKIHAVTMKLIKEGAEEKPAETGLYPPYGGEKKEKPAEGKKSPGDYTESLYPPYGGEKKEKPAEGKKSPGDYTAEELSSKLGVSLKNPAENYTKFFSKTGNFNKDLYHAELKDDEKMECLIYGLGTYKEHYITKAGAGDLWKDPEFTNKERTGINDQIARSEGIRRAFIDRAVGYTNPKDRRQALHTAVGYQPKVNTLVAGLTGKWKEIFKSEEGIKIFTLDELYKARTKGAKDIKKRKKRTILQQVREATRQGLIKPGMSKTPSQWKKYLEQREIEAGN